MPRQGPGGGLLSPSATEPKSESATEDVATVESEITRAIQQSNAPMPSKVSANRFEIKRSGHRVAVIMLARPAYRLGEVIPIIVDLHTADIHCYSLHVTLETSERIDPTIAVRSQASISRISRKIHALQHESSISAHRMFFSLAIPNNATPEFVTSGVSLEWCLRCEFVTETRENDEQEIEEGPKGLLEEVAEDERGVGLAAVQAMQCEAFDVQLPLRVYGDRKGFDDNYRIQESPI
ncbi:MAG: hypothetical protein L6R39_000532 [Caloplaca ligustica]|nr:MAG: hypothetical protein L6R39_000532 [Caloplaca ligustica]